MIILTIGSVSLFAQSDRTHIRLGNKHFRSGAVEPAEVEYSKALTKKSADGWKLNSIINDEGGKLQASLGTSEAAGSLSMGAYTSKEDRVILIFSRPKK